MDRPLFSKDQEAYVREHDLRQRQSYVVATREKAKKLAAECETFRSTLDEALPLTRFFRPEMEFCCATNLVQVELGRLGRLVAELEVTTSTTSIIARMQAIESIHRLLPGRVQRLGELMATARQLRTAELEARMAAAQVVVAAPVKPSPSASSMSTKGTCAWQGCSEPVTSRSKYCSRACSNKNARHQMKLRKL